MLRYQCIGLQLCFETRHWPICETSRATSAPECVAIISRNVSSAEPLSVVYLMGSCLKGTDAVSSTSPLPTSWTTERMESIRLAVASDDRSACRKRLRLC